MRFYEVLSGTVLLLVAAMVATRGRPGAFFCSAVHAMWSATSKDADPYYGIQRVCARLLASWSVVLLVVLLPIYYHGSNYYVSD